MPRRLRLFVSLALISGSVACTAILGDFSVSGDGSDGGSGDGTTGSDGAQGDGSKISDGGFVGDGDAAVPCGYLGEACCAGPFTACNPGTTCVSNECRTNDVWALGTYVEAIFGNNAGASVHWDGTSWRAGPNIPLSMMAGAESNPYPTALTSLAPGSFRGVSAGGYSFIYQQSPERWRECSATDFSCSHPTGNTYLWSVFGFDESDYWIGGSNSMNHCTSASCTPTTTGLPGSWGQGTLTGTSSSDLWYPQFTQAFHYNGTAWTVTTGVQARAMYAAAPNDVWGGNDHLQHFDGTNWSPLYDIDVPDAGNKPFVYSMSGTAGDDVWAAGYTNNSMGINTPFVLHWDGSGSWKQVSLPASAGAVSFIWAATRHQVFVIGGDTIYIGDGTTFTPQTLPPASDYADASFGPPGWGVLAGSGLRRLHP